MGGGLGGGDPLGVGPEGGDPVGGDPDGGGGGGGGDGTVSHFGTFEYSERIYSKEHWFRIIPFS